MGIVVLMLAAIITPIIGVSLMKRHTQAKYDHDRRTYRVFFPSELGAESVTAWVRSLTGTLRSHRFGPDGTPTVAFELWATSKGIEHRIKVPWQHADYVISQLRSLVPGIRVDPEDDVPYRRWTRAVEVGLSHSSRQLRIYNTATTSASLLAAVQAIEPGETLMMQWVVSPAAPIAPPIYQRAHTDQIDLAMLWNGAEASRDEINDRRAKLEEPNVLAVLRVASVAKTNTRATHLIYRVKASLASTRSPATRFTRRLASRATLQRRIDTVHTPAWLPMRLSAPELTALIAWPIDSPFVSGLPPVLSRQLPASDTVPETGRIIGKSNFPGHERTIAVSFEDSRKHMHILGPSGVGKTTLLANLMKQDMTAGYGVILIESKGDLFRAALNYVPQHRLQDVIVLDVNDRKRPVGFNILQQGDPHTIVDEIVALFEQLYRDARSVWTREVLYHGLHTLIADPRLTFVDLAPLLVPMTAEEIAWADNLIRSLKDRELRNFWQRFENQPRAAQDRITQPVMDRVWQLNARPEIRNIIGQSVSAFQMTDVLKDNKILLVSLAGLPKDTASLTGTLIMNSIWHAVKHVTSERPTFLYLDEFQDFVNLPVDPEDMLTKARSFGLGLTLAHQHLGQLPNELKQAVMANARTKVVFQTSADDAAKMAKEFGASVTEHDFMHLGRFEAIARIATGDGVSSPMTLATSPPAKPHNHGRQITIMSRKQYGVPMSHVEHEIAARRNEQKPSGNTQRPAIGSAELGIVEA